MAPLYLYCSQNDLYDALSISGVTLRLLDNPPGSLADGAANCRVDAASEINFYCQRIYDPAALVQSDWIRFAAKFIASYYLCTRRGNPSPGSIKDRYEEMRDLLEQVQKGLPMIPDIAARQSYMGRMSNITMRLRPTLHSRVDSGRSVGPLPQSYQQRQNWQDPAIYGVLDWTI